MEIKNYVLGEWISGEGTEIDHIHAITGEIISTTSSKGLDFSSILEYGRKKGSSALRKMTFQNSHRTQTQAIQWPSQQINTELREQKNDKIRTTIYGGRLRPKHI